MDTRLVDLQNKQIVNLKNGAMLGYADDVSICVETAKVKALIVCGRPRMFGLLGKQADLIIPWEKIRTIGEDTILVEMEGTACCEAAPPRRQWYWKKWRDFWN
ncbi:MAG: YlmC/YmxH family sporulation protein [Candidatus Merdivicinus sp.]|jgi:YlmC/YmxH family sporulation protein